MRGSTRGLPLGFLRRRWQERRRAGGPAEPTAIASPGNGEASPEVVGPSNLRKLRLTRAVESVRGTVAREAQALVARVRDAELAADERRSWPLAEAGEVGAFYLSRRHGLIRRHTEQIDLDADLSARWSLRVDLRLPDEPTARWGKRSPDLPWFLFPVAFVAKPVARVDLKVEDEVGQALPLLTAAENDEVTLSAVYTALGDMLERRGPTPEFAFTEDLIGTLTTLVSAQASRASLALGRIESAFEQIDEDDEHARAFNETLRLLMQHRVIWTPLQGSFGQRRTVVVSHVIETEPKSIRQVAVRRRTGIPDRADVPAWEKRRLPSVSLKALVERVGEPMGWLPLEPIHPTNFARRCSSYHFLLRTPVGLRCHGIRTGVISGGGAIEEAPGRTRQVLTSRSAEIHMPAAPIDADLSLRPTLVVSNGILPALWVLASVLTTALIWLFAFIDPPLTNIGRQIEAAVLLVVPALLSAMVLGAEGRVSVPSLLGGARLLVLATALAAVAATGVLVGGTPFGMDEQESSAL